MAVETSRDHDTKVTPLPKPDPALVHAVHMGPNWDRLLRLRPQDLLKPQKAKTKT